MYIEAVPNRGSPPAILLRESYREAGKVKKTAKPSKTIRANKRKAKLKAKHRRQRARATA